MKIQLARHVPRHISKAHTLRQNFKVLNKILFCFIFKNLFLQLKNFFWIDMLLFVVVVEQNLYVIRADSAPAVALFIYLYILNYFF